MGRVRDRYLEQAIATRSVVSAQVWLRQPRARTEADRREQVAELVARVERVSGIKPIEVDFDKECFPSQTHTTFWIEAPSAFMAILLLQPEIRQTNFSSRSFRLDATAVLTEGAAGVGL